MHGWTDGQYWLLYAVNLLTFLAYYALPIAWGVSQSKAERDNESFVPVFLTDLFLTRVFVFACGTHHLVMLPLMAASQGLDQFYVILLAIDSSMAIVSLLSAYRAIAQNARSTQVDSG